MDWLVNNIGTIGWVWLGIIITGIIIWYYIIKLIKGIV